LLATGGVLHGLQTGRWAGPTSAELEAAGARLDRLALSFGDWDGRALEPSEIVLADEEGSRNVIRYYLNRGSGQALTVFLACGKPVTMWGSHNPLRCYPHNGFELLAPPVPYPVPSSASLPAASFKVADFGKGNGTLTNLQRVFWTWSDDGRWRTPDDPNRAFARCRFLYKLYVVRQLNKPEEPLEKDPSLEFIQLLLPELQTALFAP
jgi:hypothetical protein